LSPKTNSIGSGFFFLSNSREEKADDCLKSPNQREREMK